MSENWIRKDVVGSVRHAIRIAQFVREDPLAWKWRFLQGACACHLATTAAPPSAVTKRNAGEWPACFEDSRADPDAKLPETHL